MSVSALRNPHTADDVVAGLRELADEIEAGKVFDWPITTCAIVLAGSEVRPGRHGKLDLLSFRSHHSFGLRCDPFTLKGVLFEAAVAVKTP